MTSSITFDADIDAKDGVAVTGGLTAGSNISATTSITDATVTPNVDLGKAICGTLSIDPTASSVSVPPLAAVPWNVVGTVAGGMTVSTDKTALVANTAGLYRIGCNVAVSGSWALSVDGAPLPDGLVDLPDSGSVPNVIGVFTTGTVSFYTAGGGTATQNVPFVFNQVGQLTRVTAAPGNNALSPSEKGVYSISVYIRTPEDNGSVWEILVNGSSVGTIGQFQTKAQGCARHTVLIELESGSLVGMQVTTPSSGTTQTVYYATLNVTRIGAVPT